MSFVPLGEGQVDSYQHAAQASVFRDSLAGASCLYLGKFSSAARLDLIAGIAAEFGLDNFLLLSNHQKTTTSLSCLLGPLTLTPVRDGRRIDRCV